MCVVLTVCFHRLSSFVLQAVHVCLQTDRLVSIVCADTVCECVCVCMFVHLYVCFYVSLCVCAIVVRCLFVCMCVLDCLFVCLFDVCLLCSLNV